MVISSLLNLLSNHFIAVTVSGLILWFVLQYIIIPWKTITSFKQEGVDTYFFPITGIFRLWTTQVKTHGDFVAHSKMSGKINPDNKYMVTNLTKYPFIFLRDPQYFREFLQKSNQYTKTKFIDFLRIFAGSGLALAEGETWKQHRKIISASFHYEFLKNNVHIVQETTKEFFDKLTPADYKDFAVIPRIQEITGEIVGRIFFGKTLSKYTFEGKSMTLALAEIISELALSARTPQMMLFGVQVMKWPIFPKLNRLLARANSFRQQCLNIIQDRKKSSDQANDFLALLLATQKSSDPAQRYSDEEIVDEFVTFFVAGMDTTGHLIGMTIYNLTKYPQYQKELEEERKKTFSLQENVTDDTLTKMEVLHSLLKETLRFYPPGPFLFFRKALEDHQILDLKIKKGMILTADLASTFFNPKFYENPDEFNPRRWTDKNAKMDPFAFIPFSAGPRNCIGQHLAMIESKLITSEFLERFEFKPKEGYKLKMTFRFLYEPEDEFTVDLTPKRRLNLQNESSYPLIVL